MCCIGAASGYNYNVHPSALTTTLDVTTALHLYSSLQYIAMQYLWSLEEKISDSSQLW